MFASLWVSLSLHPYQHIQMWRFLLCMWHDFSEMFIVTIKRSVINFINAITPKTVQRKKETGGYPKVHGSRYPWKRHVNCTADHKEALITLVSVMAVHVRDGMSCILYTNLNTSSIYRIYPWCRRSIRNIAIKIKTKSVSMWWQSITLNSRNISQIMINILLV
jgi:hypothetical protein